MTTTDHKEGEQLEDRRNGESSCNFGDETDQRVQSLMFMMMNSWQGQTIFLFLENLQTGSGVPEPCWKVKLIVHPHLVPRLRMSGAVPSLLLCAFVACTWTAIHIPAALQRHKACAAK